MPITEWEGEHYDAFLMCVDRHSGWMVVKPTRETGLTGEKAAHYLLDSTWGELGVPTVVTSDQGPQFVNQWWVTMCARLGVRSAYSQAHRPQANGRAEVAGRVLQDVLRKILVESDLNWVEALPRALRILHDTPDAITGLAPYEVVFGRERALGGLPYQPPLPCKTAEEFFDRMEFIDRLVARSLNSAHQNLVEKINKRRRDWATYDRDEWVWYRRQAALGKIKMQSYWQGPMKIIDRVGERSYRLRTTKGQELDAHADQLKPCKWEMRYPDYDGPTIDCTEPTEESDNDEDVDERGSQEEGSEVEGVEE
jgi:hypothetical protein